MNSILFFVLLVLLLAGCAAVPETPRAPDVVRVPVPFKDPEPKKRELPKKPRFMVDDLPLGAPLHDQARMCFAEREQRKAYEIELEGACR
ncbi:MAG: hypothetical protein Q8R21_04025 [Burkholderiales bacterium]|nr:hypothetical protein [Burkholderiales bacterium]